MERSIESYTKDGVSIPIPKEGDEIVLESKTHIWTKREVTDTCVIFEWVEKKTNNPSEFDWSSIHF